RGCPDRYPAAADRGANPLDESGGQPAADAGTGAGAGAGATAAAPRALAEGDADIRPALPALLLGILDDDCRCGDLAFCRIRAAPAAGGGPYDGLLRAGICA